MGQPPVLSPVEEEMMCDMAVLLGQWGFPFTGDDLRFFVKSYLDKKGVAENRFKENLPTHRWLDRFLSRHKGLTLRKSNAIKRTRAALSREEVNEFFVHFLKSMEGVEPGNLVNFDETNFRDETSIRKCICKKGTKYVETVRNTSKQAISVMFAGTADGEMFPPMIVYKAQNIYTSWTERGPKGALYSCSKSGWFDGCQFEKFFFELLLPKLKRRTGKKLLIGDNLASHFSPDVINACRENNIAFVCLPANSTDKLQPLDVGIFAPLKNAWRKVLEDYKRKNPKEAGISKSEFPALLARQGSTYILENLALGGKISFSEGGGGNKYLTIVFGPNYRPLLPGP
jgi:hypothetical protein